LGRKWWFIGLPFSVRGKPEVESRKSEVEDRVSKVEVGKKKKRPGNHEDVGSPGSLVGRRMQPSGWPASSLATLAVDYQHPQ
jgi:hypothetical protein